jgi:hypothetical protein
MTPTHFFRFAGQVRQLEALYLEAWPAELATCCGGPRHSLRFDLDTAELARLGANWPPLDALGYYALVIAGRQVFWLWKVLRPAQRRRAAASRRYRTSKRRGDR